MLRLATRGDLEALIETERPAVPPAEAFAVLNRLALRTTGLPLRDLIRRPEVTKKAKAVQKKLGRSA
jgi:hypothetical protein